MTMKKKSDGVFVVITKFFSFPCDFDIYKVDFTMKYLIIIVLVNETYLWNLEQFYIA